MEIEGPIIVENVENQGAENERDAEIILGMNQGEAQGAELFEDQGVEQNEEDNEPITDNVEPNNQDESDDEDISREEEIRGRNRTTQVTF